jgi:ankyrin repeat protein
VTVNVCIKILSQTHQLLNSASVGEVACVQQLLDSGVPLDAASPGGFTAIHAACVTGQQEVLELLLQHHQQQRQQHQGNSSSASLEPHLPYCMAAAASMGHAGIIQLIVSVLDLKQVTLQPWKPLQAAAAAGHGSVVQLLLQQCGMTVDQAFEGTSALHLAASRGHLQVVQQLLQAGADVDFKTRRASETALHIAASRGHLQVVRQLLQAGAEVDARTADIRSATDRWTPLHFAADAGWSDVVQQLLHAGAEVNARSAAASWTPLHLAARSGPSDVAQLLLQSGADVHARLHCVALCSIHRQVDVVQLLLTTGAGIDARSDSEETPLSMAVARSSSEAAKLLLQLGACVHAANKHGIASLHRAAKIRRHSNGENAT